MTKQDVKEAVIEALKDHGHICQVFPTEEDRVLVQGVVDIARGVKEKGISYAIKGAVALMIFMALVSVAGIAALARFAPALIKALS